MTTRDQVVAMARTCLGVRFRHQGREPEQGLDCVGLVIYTRKQLGLSSFDYLNYAHTPDPAKLIELLRAELVPIEIDEVQPGDVLHFRVGNNPVHVGLATDNGVIHSVANLRGVVEHRLDDEWRSRIVAAYQIPGVS